MVRRRFNCNRIGALSHWPIYQHQKEEIMGEDKVFKKKAPAIKAMRDYLIELLEEESWCKADRVGDMLKTLLVLSPPTPSLHYEGAQQGEMYGRSFGETLGEREL